MVHIMLYTKKLLTREHMVFKKDASIRARFEISSRLQMHIVAFLAGSEHPCLGWVAFLIRADDGRDGPFVNS